MVLRKIMWQILHRSRQTQQLSERGFHRFNLDRCPIGQVCLGRQHHNAIFDFAEKTHGPLIRSRRYNAPTFESAQRCFLVFLTDPLPAKHGDAKDPFRVRCSTLDVQRSRCSHILSPQSSALSPALRPTDSGRRRPSSIFHPQPSILRSPYPFTSLLLSCFATLRLGALVQLFRFCTPTIRTSLTA